uniref:Uncharacterized protein n=1 Tax=Tetraselmis sp. GSL018 TaxID=582737 RepID=A0A061QVH7_9CHLO
MIGLKSPQCHLWKQSQKKLQTLSVAFLTPGQLKCKKLQQQFRGNRERRASIR